MTAGRAVVCLLALSLGTLGCKGDREAKPSADQAAQSTEIDHREDELLARRDSLVKARQRIRSEREALEGKRRAALAAGGDTSVIDEAASKLVDREAKLAQQEAELMSMQRDLVQERREFSSELRAVGASNTDRVAAREERTARREREIAQREQTVAQREQELANREQALAKREAQMCGVASAPTTIIKTVDAKGTSYTEKDVEPLLNKARAKMSSKGILKSDLPAPAQELEAEAHAAMKSGDYGTARLAAQQLYKTISAISVDRGFIAAKIRRLNSLITGKKFSADQQKQVDALFLAATSDYGDGKFSSANRKLNKIYALVR